MKAAAHIAWIVLGSLLGLAIAHWRSPELQPVPEPVATTPTHTATQPKPESTTLYTNLPELENATPETATALLAKANFAASPARRRLELHRLLIAIAQDPEKIQTLVDNLQASSTRKSDLKWITNEIYKHWASTDPTTALASASALGERGYRWGATRGALTVWATADPMAALAYAEQTTLDMGRHTGREIVLETLAETDPQRAISEALRLGDARLEESLHRHMIKKIATTDIDRAWTEIATVTDEKRRASLQSAALDGIADADPAAALAFTDQLTDVKQRESHLRRVFRLWPMQDVDTAAGAFLKLPAESTPDFIAHDFGQSMYFIDSGDALAFSKKLTGKTRDHYVLGALTEHAYKQPAKAAAAAAEMITDPAHLARLYGHLGSTWGEKDEHATAEWIAALPDSPARDKAADSFSNKLFSIDPERAIQWATSISDPKTRDNRLNSLLDQWQKQDPTAATTYLLRTTP